MEELEKDEVIARKNLDNKKEELESNIERAEEYAPELQ